MLGKTHYNEDTDDYTASGYDKDGNLVEVTEKTSWDALIKLLQILGIFSVIGGLVYWCCI